MRSMLELHPTGARILPKSAFYSSWIASNDGVVDAVGAAEAVTRSMAHAPESSLLEVSGIPGPLCPSLVGQATVVKVNQSISNQRNQVSAASPANGGCGARVLPALPVAPVEPLRRPPSVQQGEDLNRVWGDVSRLLMQVESSGHHPVDILTHVVQRTLRPDTMERANRGIPHFERPWRDILGRGTRAEKTNSSDPIIDQASAHRNRS